ARTAQPNRDLPFWPRQDPGPVDPVVGVLVIDHGLFPQLADQSDLLLLPLAAAPKMSRHLETVVFHPVPADAHTQAKSPLREQVNIRGLFGKKCRLSLR